MTPLSLARTPVEYHGAVVLIMIWGADHELGCQKLLLYCCVFLPTGVLPGCIQVVLTGSLNCVYTGGTNWTPGVIKQANKAERRTLLGGVWSSRRGDELDMIKIQNTCVAKLSKAEIENLFFFF